MILKSKELNIKLVSKPKPNSYGAVICAVAHEKFLKTSPSSIRKLCTTRGFIYDLKNVLPKECSDLRL